MAPHPHLHLLLRRLLPLLLLVAALRETTAGSEPRLRGRLDARLPQHLLRGLPTSSGAAAVVEDHHPWIQECFKILDGTPDALPRCRSLARLRFLAENEDTTISTAAAKEVNPNCSHDAQGTSNWIDLAMAILCVLGAALASGLTVGLISTDRLELEIKLRVGTPAEQWQAKRLLPILRHKHLLLVSLVLFNAAAAEALPLFLDGLVPTYMAILISVTMVLFFCEILPQAVMTGPKQLKFGAQLTPVVWVLMALFFPIAWPISLLLDRFLGEGDGEKGKRYSRTELSALVEIHQKQAKRRQQQQQQLQEQQLRNLQRAKTVSRATPPFVGPPLGRTASIGSLSSEDSDLSSLELGGAGPGSMGSGFTGIRIASASPGLLAGPSFDGGFDGNRDDGDDDDVAWAEANQHSFSFSVGSLSSGGGDSSPMGKRSHTGSFSSYSSATTSKANKDKETKKRQAAAAASASLLTKREVDIVVGVLGIASKTVADCMVPWDKVCCISGDLPLDAKSLADIRAVGYSRIPVCRQRRHARLGFHDARFVVGYVLTKNLIVVDPQKRLTVGKVGGLRCPVMVSPDCPLIDILSTFQLGRAHLALVSRAPEAALQMMMEGRPLIGADVSPVGIITLEDVLQVMLQAEILDEKDRQGRGDEEDEVLPVMPASPTHYKFPGFDLTQGQPEENRGARETKTEKEEESGVVLGLQKARSWRRRVDGEGEETVVALAGGAVAIPAPSPSAVTVAATPTLAMASPQHARMSSNWGRLREAVKRLPHLIEAAEQAQNGGLLGGGVVHLKEEEEEDQVLK